MTITRAETSTIDLFSDHTLQNTQEVFEQLRETAAVVHLPANDVWAVTRYEDIREALSDPATFSSKSVAFNPQMNEILSGCARARTRRQGQLRWHEGYGCCVSGVDCAGSHRCPRRPARKNLTVG